jgi:hypothetical protein
MNPNNAGGVWVDQNGVFGPNYGACLQLTDATNGAACAKAYDAVSDCNGVQCDSCSDATTYQTCVQTVNAGICQQYASAAQTACASDFADGGAASTCSPGSATQKQDPDFTYIITLICGGGSSDAGGGG